MTVFHFTEDEGDDNDNSNNNDIKYCSNNNNSNILARNSALAGFWLEWVGYKRYYLRKVWSAGMKHFVFCFWKVAIRAFVAHTCCHSSVAHLGMRQRQACNRFTSPQVLPHLLYLQGQVCA